MNLLRCWLREWHVGWHQGQRERAERDVARHAAAEAHWRDRRHECTHCNALHDTATNNRGNQ